MYLAESLLRLEKITRYLGFDKTSEKFFDGAELASMDCSILRY